LSEKIAYWLSEVGTKDNQLVGKKCANLGELDRAGVRVPPGFAISVFAYGEFMRRSGALAEMGKYVSTFKADIDDMDAYQAATSALRDIVESKNMPEDMAEIIASDYDELCARTGINDLAVSVRSAGAVSHPGQYETYLNVSGKVDMMKHIIKVWGSTFNHRSLMWRARNHYPLEWDPIGVAVLKMVNARSAGVMFTLNPSNGDFSKIVIEANWGLGESVVSGKITPDWIMVDKVTLEILEKRIMNKALQFERNPVTGQTDFVDVPAELQDKPCLSDEEIRELARQAKKVEKHSDGKPQDTEWAIDKDLPFPENVIFLQTRNESVWATKKAEPVFAKGKNPMDDILGIWGKK
jgi:pyruvate,water dikinase